MNAYDESAARSEDRTQRVARLGDVFEIGLLHFLIGFLHDNEAFCQAVDEQLAVKEQRNAKLPVAIVCPSCHYRGGHSLSCSLRPPCPVDNLMITPDNDYVQMNNRPDNGWLPPELPGYHCGDESEGWTCAARSRHTGDHAAYTETGVLLHTWGDRPLSRLVEDAVTA